MTKYRNNALWRHAAMMSQRLDSLSVPRSMTQDELVRFLHMPEISSAKDQHNVIEHLKRYRNLPRIRLCKIEHSIC